MQTAGKALEKARTRELCTVNAYVPAPVQGNDLINGQCWLGHDVARVVVVGVSKIATRESLWAAQERLYTRCGKQLQKRRLDIRSALRHTVASSWFIRPDARSLQARYARTCLEQIVLCEKGLSCRM